MERGGPARGGVWSPRARSLLNRGKRAGAGGVETGGMSETTGAPPRPAVRVVDDVEDDVVGPRGIAADPAHAEQEVEVQKVPHAPGDVVVRARRVAAGPQPSDHLPVGVVERQPAAE